VEIEKHDLCRRFPLHAGHPARKSAPAAAANITGANNHTYVQPPPCTITISLRHAVRPACALVTLTRWALAFHTQNRPVACRKPYPALQWPRGRLDAKHKQTPTAARDGLVSSAFGRNPSQPRKGLLRQVVALPKRLLPLLVRCANR